MERRQGRPPHRRRRYLDAAGRSFAFTTMRRVDPSSGFEAVPASLAAMVSKGLASARLVFGNGAELPGPALADQGHQLVHPQADVDCIGALLTNDPATVGLVLGAITAGTRLVSLPLPPRAPDLTKYAELLLSAASQHGFRKVVVRDDAAELLRTLGVPAIGHEELHSNPIAAAAPNGFELIQYTSGSTGKPKGVVLDDATLGANIAAMLRRVGPVPGDTTVSWLPLSHDLGLVGMLLTSICAGDPSLVGNGTIVLLEPEQFLRRPSIWLDAVDEFHGTFTAAPDFGYRMSVRGAPSRTLDLSRLRCAVVGGEIVRQDTLEQVSGRLARFGLRPESLCPAYGMAELGLAATMTPPGIRWRVKEVDGLGLGDGLASPPRRSRRSTGVVSAGPPLDGYEILAPAAPGPLGRIRIVPPAIGRDAESGLSLADDGIFTSSDIGFTDGGWLYPCGRDDDHINANGRAHHAPTIEHAVAKVNGVRAGRVTVFGAPEGEWVIAVEAGDLADAGSIGRLKLDIRKVAVEICSARPSEVVVLPPGRLPMTSSGKVQRKEVARRWLAGELEA